MQVYKLFFKILNKHKGQVIMYICIFISIATMVSSQGQENEKKMFQTSEYELAVFDEDGSEESKAFCDFLLKDNKKVELADEKEAIQDALYERDVKAVVRIPQGFFQHLQDGTVENQVVIQAVPGTIYGQTAKTALNRFCQIYRTYSVSGMSREDALAQTKTTCDQEITVDFPEDYSGTAHSKMYYFFNYIPFVAISLCVVGIGPILLAFRRKEVRKRTECSCYPLGKSNRELIAAVATTGLGFYLIFFLVTVVESGGDVFTTAGLLMALNMLLFMLVSIGMVFILGRVIKSENTVNLLSNILALGMSFLCGVFVPLELMSDGIVKVAHFLPAYWYVRATTVADQYQPGAALSEYWQGIGIQVLFAVALFAAGLAISKAQHKAAAEV